MDKDIKKVLGSIANSLIAICLCLENKFGIPDVDDIFEYDEDE